MYKLFADCTESDIMWINCHDKETMIKIVDYFIEKGVTSYISNFDFLPHVLYLKNKNCLLPVGASQAATLRNNNIRLIDGNIFIDDEYDENTIENNNFKC